MSMVHHHWFQSTRPRGARRGGTAGMVTLTGFQSTRPRGARHPGRSPSIGTDRSFNPRARAGRDCMGGLSGHEQAAWFQSTRPRGARLTCRKYIPYRHFHVDVREASIKDALAAETCSEQHGKYLWSSTIGQTRKVGLLPAAYGSRSPDCFSSPSFTANGSLQILICRIAVERVVS